MKTTLTSLGGCVVLPALFALGVPQVAPPPLETSLAVVIIMLIVACIVISAGGAIVLYRWTRDNRGLPDLFYQYYSRLPADRPAGWRRWIRPLLGEAPRPGDVVRIRSQTEILATLDDVGRLDGVPFMPEMLEYLTHVLLVDRRIDKVNDWLGGNKLRRVKRIVTLVDTRCSGAYHGGCNAACQLLWHERWLVRESVWRKKPSSAAPTGSRPTSSSSPSESEKLAVLLSSGRATHVQHGGRTTEKYTCQLTELPRISAPMSRWDIRQDLRPLVNGNLPLAAWLVAVLTGVFNAVQRCRGGAEYPVMAPQLTSGPTPAGRLELQPGDLVQVRSKREIGLTLHKNHNRGMWFGRETLRFCGRQYRVRSRVHRIIHERSGEMIVFRDSAVILDSVCGSGEFLRFCPQNEFVFWRDIWLEKLDAA